MLTWLVKYAIPVLIGFGAAAFGCNALESGIAAALFLVAIAAIQRLRN